jgi:Contractile injection system tube protein
MTDIEKAKLYHASGPTDRPPRNGEGGISVMFNPTSLKVTLANSLKENERNSNHRAAQYVDKSSSTFTVELIFDSTDQYERRGTVRKDVRKYSGAIANEFMKPEAVGDKDVEPKRCMFVWGTFLFVGIMESFDETLDFFSSEGTALRSTVSIKMTESRFQFESEDAKRARRDTPRLGRDSASPHSATSDAGQDEKNWRDTSMYNGLESPRSPTSGLAVPSAGLSASVGLSAGINGGISGGIGAGIGGGIGVGMSGGISAGISGGLSTGISGNIGSSVSVQPGFNFGASSNLGSGIPGAFSVGVKNTGSLTAGGIIAASSSLNVTGSNSLRSSTSINTNSNRISARGSVTVSPGGIKSSGSIGFD